MCAPGRELSINLIFKTSVQYEVSELGATLDAKKGHVRVVLPHFSPLRRSFRINELHATKHDYNIIENFLLPVTFLNHTVHSSFRHCSDINVTQRGLSVLIPINA